MIVDFTSVDSIKAFVAKVKEIAKLKEDINISSVNIFDDGTMCTSGRYDDYVCDILPEDLAIDLEEYKRLKEEREAAKMEELRLRELASAEAMKQHELNQLKSLLKKYPDFNK